MAARSTPQSSSSTATSSSKGLKKGSNNPPKKSPRKSAKEVMSTVPTHDKDGFLYSKREVRVMRKRVRRGECDFLLTEGEREELKKRRVEDRDDDDLMGLVYVKGKRGGGRKVVGEEGSGEEEGSEGEEEGESEGEEKEEVEGEEESEKEEEETEEEEVEGEGDKEGSDVEDASVSEGSAGSTSLPPSPPPSPPTPPVGAKRASKPVPPGYVCSACKGELGKHWIFDCQVYKDKKNACKPPKQEQQNKGKQKKDNAGIIHPSANKVFVSGLPYDVKNSSVMEFFSPFGAVSALQLFCFDDSKRCKGEGIVTFEDAEGAGKAIEEGNGRKFEDSGRWLKIEKVKPKMGGKGKVKRGKGRGGKGGKGGKEKKQKTE